MSEKYTQHVGYYTKTEDGITSTHSVVISAPTVERLAAAITDFRINVILRNGHEISLDDFEEIYNEGSARYVDECDYCPNWKAIGTECECEKPTERNRK